MSSGQIPYDDNSKPVLALWNDATGQVIPAHVKSTVTGADGKTYGILDTGSGGGGGGAVNDLLATGIITAAQPTEGTPVANATVVLALGSGQATWEAQITGLGSGSTVAFDGVDDTGVSTNWQAAVGYSASIINPPPITSLAGPGPFIIRGTSSGYQQIRVRCTVYNGTDSIAVRLLGSVGSLAGAGGLVSNDGTFAKESGGNLATIATNIPAKGAATTSASTPVNIASDQTVPTNIAQWNGTAVSIKNPVITEDQIRAWILSGNSFTAYINGSVTAGNAAAVSLFFNNPTKNILIYRVSTAAATAGSNCKLSKQTTDFALGAGGAVAVNVNLGSATTSIATVSSSISASSSGTIFDYTLLPSDIVTEILTGGECIYIPAGTTMAFAAFCDLVSTTGAGFVSISWVEF